MSVKGQKMQVLIELRDSASEKIKQLERELEGQKRYLDGIEAALQAMTGSQNDGNEETGSSRVNVKPYVMDAIEASGLLGITASEIVEFAAKRGAAIKQPSVSSLLSRMKGDGILKFEGERYYPLRGSTVSGAPPTSTSGTSRRDMPLHFRSIGQA